MTFLEIVAGSRDKLTRRRLIWGKYRESEFTKIGIFIHGYFMATNN